MSRRLAALDRLWTLLLGLGLVALGLLALDWRFRVVLGGYPDTLSTGTAADLVDSSWWPWAAALGGVVLGLLGLGWILAHVRRPGPGTLRAAASDHTGRIEVDLRSVATAAAGELERTAPVSSASGGTAGRGGTDTVLVRARVEPDADAGALADAVASCAAQVDAAFPDDPVSCRILLEAPARPRRRAEARSDRVRVD